MGSKRKKKRKQQRMDVASGSVKRREKAERGYNYVLNLPKETETFSIKSVGTKRIDIIPYIVGKGNPNWDEGEAGYERTFFVHNQVGSDKQRVICPAKTIGKKCPICQYRSKLDDDPDADEQTVKSLRPSQRMVLNVVDLKKDPETVKIWNVSDFYFGQALDQALDMSYEDHDENMDGFCNPVGGYYLKALAQKPSGGYPGFQVTRVDFVPRKDDLDDEILEQAICLDEILEIKSYEEIKELFFSDSDEDDDGADEEEEKPKSSKKKKKKKSSRKKKEEEDDEDGEDDDGEDDDGEDDDDWDDDNGEDDDDWDDDVDEDWDDDVDDGDDGNDDEEEEKPKSSKKKKKKKKRK